MALNTMLALEDVQVAVIKYLRDFVGEYNVGDFLPKDKKLNYYVHLKDSKVKDVSVKGNYRAVVSFTFHVISEVRNGAGNFLQLIEAIESMVDADITLVNYDLNDVKLTAMQSFVDLATDKYNRHAIITMDFTVSKIK